MEEIKDKIESDSTLNTGTAIAETEDKSEIIDWKREFETGIVLIDKQHRKLVDLINNLSHAYNNKHEREVLRETILKLVEYTKFHFSFEEKHMQQSNYLRLEDHSAMHKIFINEMISILNKLKVRNYENLTIDILEFLKKWLVEHILVQDKNYGKFYKIKKRYD